LGHEHKTLSYRLCSEGPQLRTLYEALARVEYGLAIERDGLPARGSARRAGGRAAAAPIGSGGPGRVRPERPRATARARGPRDDSAGSARRGRGAGGRRTVAGDDRATRAERAAAAATALRRRAGGRGPSPAEAP
jgi:hypothetical protein